MRVEVRCSGCLCAIRGNTYDDGGRDPMIAGQAGHVATTHTDMPLREDCPRETCPCHAGGNRRPQMLVSLVKDSDR